MSERVDVFLGRFLATPSGTCNSAFFITPCTEMPGYWMRWAERIRTTLARPHPFPCNRCNDGLARVRLEQRLLRFQS